MCKNKGFYMTYCENVESLDLKKEKAIDEKTAEKVHSSMVSYDMVLNNALAESTATARNIGYGKCKGNVISFECFALSNFAA
jgi:hypothetical protein